MSTSAVAQLPLGGELFPSSSFAAQAAPLSPQVESLEPSHEERDSWENEVIRDGFARDIALNIKDLADTVASNKHIDNEFFDILQQDIDHLRSAYTKRDISPDSHVWSELYRMNIRLQEVAAKRYGWASASHAAPSSSLAAYTSSSLDDGFIPLVGKIDDPLSLLSEEGTPVSKGLQILHDGGYRVRRVRGNGHCLFSSIASHLVTKERLAHVRELVGHLRSEGLLGAIDPLPYIREFEQKLASGVSVETLLQNEQNYAASVVLLRTIAANWWRKEIAKNEERLVALAHDAREAMPDLRSNSDNKQVCETYLRRMVSMTECRYGGQPEIFALKNILGIDIRAVDLKDLGTESSKRAVDTILPTDGDRPGIWLVYHGSHFDPLYLPERVEA